MAVTIALLALVALVAVAVLLRRRSAATAHRPAAPRPATSETTTAYQAVSIKYSANACAAAKELDGRRFLSGAAPRLPLRDCDVLECNCRFVNHKDRRSGDDRRNPYQSGIAADTGQHPQEQRQGRERRKDADDLS
ncbi:MAG: hypothetical protein ACREQZ_08935 [Woeseiaceae bacterium]